MSEKEYVKLSKALHVLDVVMSDDSIKHKGKAVRKRLLELPTEDIEKLKAEIDDLETKLAINKGAMRAYREECEKAHDEAVKDFSHFLIDKAKDGSIDVDELPDLVVEWMSPSRKAVDVMEEIGGVFNEAAVALGNGSVTGKSVCVGRIMKCSECDLLDKCPSGQRCVDAIGKDFERYCPAREVVEKQTSKKPVKKNPICYNKTKDGQEYYAYDYHCPVCDEKLKLQEHHCPCGQALDWSDSQ